MHLLLKIRLEGTISIHPGSIHPFRFDAIAVTAVSKCLDSTGEEMLQPECYCI